MDLLLIVFVSQLAYYTNPLDVGQETFTCTSPLFLTVSFVNDTWLVNFVSHNQTLFHFLSRKFGIFSFKSFHKQLYTLKEHYKARIKLFLIPIVKLVRLAFQLWIVSYWDLWEPSIDMQIMLFKSISKSVCQNTE